MTVHAKLDTGAKTSSINAVHVESFTRDGESWVHFSLSNHDGKTASFEGAVVRISKIKRHNGDKQQRPVINLEICVGPVRKTVEVNLIDRTGLNYPLLIGRNFLGDALLVDAGHTYLQAGCRAH